jgi:hypothetical protein
MSVPRFERDDGDDQPRGRVVPLQPEPSALLIDIRVGGVTFGTIDPLTLKARAQLDLERARGALDLLRWCQTHAGGSGERGADGEPSELDRLEEELAEMPLSAVMDLIVSISGALGEAVQIPKRSGRR